MKRIIYLLLGIIALFAPRIVAEQWRLHPTFAPYLTRIIDTPNYVFVLTHNQPWNLTYEDYAMPTGSLFLYDKKENTGDWLNVQNRLSSHVPVTAEYNFDKNYLMVGYDNGDIDILYDNGKTVNVPGFRVNEGSFSKQINSFSFVPGGNMAYVATDFGYLTINDEKGEIGVSRILDMKVNSVVEFDGRIYLGTDDGLYLMSPKVTSTPEKVDGVASVRRLLISGDNLYMLEGENWDSKVQLILRGEGPEDFKNVVSSYVEALEQTRSGVLVSGYANLWHRNNNNGDMTVYVKPEETHGLYTTGYSDGIFWVDRGLKGVSEIQAPASAEWKATGRTLLPNAANGFKSNAMAYSDRYGMLVRNHGFDNNFTNVIPFPPDYISGLKGGVWTPYSIAARLPDNTTFKLALPNGVAIDPNDPDMVYCGSVQDGILRLNLADPEKSLRLGLKTDPAVGNPGFVAVTDPPAEVPSFTPFSKSVFDSYGTMWNLYFNLDDWAMELWHWTAEDRKASTSASNYRPMKRWSLPNSNATNAMDLLALKGSQTKNIIAMLLRTELRVIDHNGTLDNRADDKSYVFTSSIYDQDGGKVEYQVFNTLHEDPLTGNIWVGHDQGVFWFNPRDLKSGSDSRVNRIKVPRNDGTNYADYLLEGVSINAIAVDGNGRKWFATNGAGVTCTSSTGTEIVKIYNEDNSLLPSNFVYGLCYNPENNSMMFSTDSGLAELFLTGNESGDSDQKAVVYPNPVRPDFYGYVKIEGLEDGALVKITDAAGNLIKQLDRADWGETQWDVTNLNMKRVKSGVYYVLASGSEGSGYSNVAKILVVN